MNPTKEKITQAQIAQKLGVATSTVQRALLGSQRISKETRERVLAEARRHGYRHDVMAQGLRSGRTKTLGVVFGRVMPSHVAIFTGIEEEANRRGYSAMLAISDYSSTLEKARVEQLLSRAVDGLIVASIDPSWPEYNRIAEEGRPVIFNGPTELPAAGPIVRVDEIAANRKITEHLLELGHRHIGYIETGHLRSKKIPNPPIEGYLRALKAAGVAVDPGLIFKVPLTSGAIGENRLNTYENGELAIRTLLTKRPNITAVVCYGGPIAAGVIGASTKLGLRIPKDLSVASSHDDYLPAFLNPRVTGISVPYQEIGKLLADLALDKLSGVECSTEKEVYIPSELIIRESTSPPIKQRQVPRV